METDKILALVFMLILITMGILVIIGKGDWMISGYNTASSEEKAKYNILRLRIVTGSAVIIYPILVIICKLMDVSAILTGIVYLPFLLAAIVLGNTWAKRK